ncbi:MAG: signal peptide peptidase SppA [Janthinobacterium lividum]
MSLETDLLVDRARLKRGLVVWRVVAVLAVLGAVASAASVRGRVAVGGLGVAHVARLSVDGVITDDRKLVEAVDRLAKDGSVRALIVAVDSPGGSVAGGEALHDAIARVAKAKPVVAVMGGAAASAGYMVSVPAERIFARQSTLTGSIGVILEQGDISGLLGKIGVNVDPLVSGPLKGQPSFTAPLSAEGRVVMQALVQDLFEQFVAMVADGRHMDAARVRELADGRPYTGRQALPLGLVDQIGGEPEARAWLAEKHQVGEGLAVADVVPGRGFLARQFSSQWSGAVSAAMKAVLLQGVSLDGAWALWQPSRL